MHSLLDLHKNVPGSKIAHCEAPDKLQIAKLATLHQDIPNSMTYVNTKVHLKKAQESQALAVLIHNDWIDDFSKPVLAVNDVDYALIQILNLLYPADKPSGKRGEFVVIDASVTVGDNCDIGNFVSIGANCNIGKNAIISDGVKIGAGVLIGDDARIGPNCVIFDSVQVGDRFTVFGNTTIGGDGYRFIDKDKKLLKVPQVGSVVIGDDVEIGSNTSIDRGGIDNTMIGDGTKLDNDVQIAHNVKIGKHVIVAGATAIAGSTIVEDYCKISGACAVGDHMSLPSGTMLAGGTGLRNTPPKPDLYAGWDWNLTFREFQKFRANIKHMLSLNRLVKRVSNLEEKLDK